jgi:hypothetical protein
MGKERDSTPEILGFQKMIGFLGPAKWAGTEFALSQGRRAVICG